MDLYLFFLAAGHIFAVGGFDGRDHLNTSEKFDPHTNKWVNLAPMAKAR